MLNEVKIMLGIASNDSECNALLEIIINSATARLRTLLGGMEPPESLRYIIRDVSVMRYNRIGSEGMTSHTVEGESQHYADNDFDCFTDDIKAFLATQKNSAVGRVRFL